MLPAAAERNPPIEEVISQGVIPRFVQFLAAPNPTLQASLTFCAPGSHKVAAVQLATLHPPLEAA